MAERMDELELAAHPASVSQARRMVRAVVMDSARPELSDDAELLTSEVVTNALVHAGGLIRIAAKALRAGVRVEVVDGSPHSPIVRHYGELAGTGRGVQLLDLLARWGVEHRPGGKAVWFELGETRGRDATALAPDHVAVGVTPGRRPVDEVGVTLLHMPLLLHAAWQVHAESFLREFLLARLDEGDAEQVMAEHAAASDALALLKAQIPVPDLGEDPAAVMAGATGSKVSAPSVTLRVPGGSVANFALLDRMLDAALELAEPGGFLTPPMQPELRAMRRWICAEVAEQADGRAPQVWELRTSDLDAPRRLPMVWDASKIEAATTAVIVADDTNLILAASRPALALLGYSEGELVGRRLLAIVPERFHQAHLAGFSMHLLSGRGPLIGVPVTVPAVRADGSEVSVELTVRRMSSETGRPVFVAEMRAGQGSGGHPTKDPISRRAVDE